jgi:cysteine desulfurase
MAANNETGVLHPVAAVAGVAHEAGALFHCDATQALGRIPVSVSDCDVDLLSVSGHKIHGPRGVGALVVDPDAPLRAVQHGGGQERGLRPGTLNTPGIVGMGVACTLSEEHLQQVPGVLQLRDRLWRRIRDEIPEASLNGASAPRLPNTVNIRFHGAEAEAVVAGMPSVACSTGSACSAGTPGPSHVLLAMGYDDRAASESIRFSLAVQTNDRDIDEAVQAIAESVGYVRRMTGEGAA